MSPCRAWLTVLGLALLAVVTGAACRKQAPPRETETDAAREARPAVDCPTREPRSGIACQASTGQSCRYEVETCAGPGGRVYARTYCCFSGSWEECGFAEPCERLDAAPEQPGDPDAGLDASPAQPPEPAPEMPGDPVHEPPVDAAPESTTCGGEPPPSLCDGNPCSPCPGGGSARCACIGASWFCQICGDGGAGSS